MLGRAISPPTNEVLSEKIILLKGKDKTLPNGHFGDDKDIWHNFRFLINHLLRSMDRTTQYFNQHSTVDVFEEKKKNQKKHLGRS